MPNIEFDVDKIAKLAMLDLTDTERAVFQNQLPSILAYVSKLQEVDTDNIIAKTYLSSLNNVFRKDEVIYDENVGLRVVGEFPEQKGGFLSVPGIFE